MTSFQWLLQHPSPSSCSFLQTRLLILLSVDAPRPVLQLVLWGMRTLPDAVLLNGSILLHSVNWAVQRLTIPSAVDCFDWATRIHEHSDATDCSHPQPIQSIKGGHGQSHSSLSNRRYTSRPAFLSACQPVCASAGVSVRHAGCGSYLAMVVRWLCRLFRCECAMTGWIASQSAMCGRGCVVQLTSATESHDG